MNGLKMWLTIVELSGFVLVAASTVIVLKLLRNVEHAEGWRAAGCALVATLIIACIIIRFIEAWRSA